MVNINKDANILVVDDDRELADLAVEYLTTLGYKATPVYGGKEAFDLFSKGDFQVVITDLVMPDMNGMELLEAVKRIDKQVPVIVITGHGTVESAVEAIKKGAYDYLPKPIRMGEVEVIVKRALERQTLAKQLGLFRGLTLALLISIPFWLILGIILTLLFK